MMELFTCRLNRNDKPLRKSELIAAVGDPDALSATVDDRIADRGRSPDRASASMS
jgi:hypothetical protein